MEQVATSDATSAKVQSKSTPKQRTACLRLKQGASAQGTLLLEDVPGGTHISIGSSSSCDWQVRAASVADHALDVMMLGGKVFARCPEHSSVLLDGRPLDEHWNEVPDGSRIDIGLARLEVNVFSKTSAFGHLPDAYAPILLTSSKTAPMYDSKKTAPMYEEYEDDVQVVSEEPAQPAQRALTGKATVAYGQRLEDLVEPEVLHQARVSFAERLSRSSMFDMAPNLLGEGVDHRSRRTVWRYAALAVGTLAAYAGWIVLLEHL